MDRVKRIWYLSPMRAAKVQASLRIRAVSPEPSLLAHTSSESRGTFRQKARSLAPLNGCARAVTICHDGMLEDTNSLDGAQMIYLVSIQVCTVLFLTLKLCQISDMKSKFQHCYLSYSRSLLGDWRSSSIWNRRTHVVLCVNGNVNSAAADTHISHEFSLYSTSKDN